MGFPMEMFPVLFAIPRVSGWLAHWQEMLEQDQRIARPRQVYVGHPRAGLRPPPPALSAPADVEQELADVRVGLHAAVGLGHLGQRVAGVDHRPQAAVGEAGQDLGPRSAG